MISLDGWRTKRKAPDAPLRKSSFAKLRHVKSPTLALESRAESEPPNTAQDDAPKPDDAPAPNDNVAAVSPPSSPPAEANVERAAEGAPVEVVEEEVESFIEECDIDRVLYMTTGKCTNDLGGFMCESPTNGASQFCTYCKKSLWRW
jgi:hypothetical protein